MPDFDFSSYKVLMCDQDPETIDIARTTYLDAGIGDFVATPSSEEALKHIPVMKPDVILVALKLGSVNGISVVQKIRSMKDGIFYKTPVLLLLEKVSTNMLREACRAGIEGALRKPINASKYLRFTRAVILKPRRFICVRHYFGPERRMRDNPHFSGQDRRTINGLTSEDLTTDTFTQNITPGKSALGSEPVLSTPAPNQSRRAEPNANAERFDWGKSETKPKADGGVMDYSSAEFNKSQKAQPAQTQESGAAAPQNSKEAGYDFTSADKPAAKTDFDYGKSETQPVKTQTEVPASETKKVTPPEDLRQQAAETKAAAPAQPVEPTGPDSDDFEEVMDLDECLDLHKVWVNSGGKIGQQANRPHSDFRGQDLEGADFTRAILPQSNFEEVDCTNVVLRKADLTGSTFRKALLISADLRVSRLSKADLRNAKMDQANLLGADLTGANLEGASLYKVNFSGANLNRTNLRGLNLTSCQGLISDQIKRAITDQTTQLPLSARTPS